MSKPLATLLLAALLGAPLSAHAQMRCGTELIVVGDTKAQVVDACGEPDYIDGYRWYYHSETQQPRVIVFNSAGQVEAIKTVL